MDVLSPEQIATSQKVGGDTLIGLTTKAVEGVEKRPALNLRLLKTTLSESQNETPRAISVKGPQEWLALHTTLAAPLADKIQAYASQVFDIVSAMHTELSHLGQSQYRAYNDQVKTLFENAGQRAPAVAEISIGTWNSAVTKIVFDSLQKTSQQAVKFAEQNFTALASTASASKSALSSAGSAQDSAQR